MGFRAEGMTQLATRFGMTAAMAVASLLLAVVAAGASLSRRRPPPPSPPPQAKVKLGLSINDPRAFRGYTLLNPMNKKTTYLIDMEGRVVKTWESEHNSMHAAYLLANGHLFRVAVLDGGERAFGGGPGSAGRIQEFAWDGDLVWDFQFHNDKQYPHHDAAKMPNGNVLMVVWDKKTADEAIAAGRKKELVSDYVLPDSIVEVKPTGKTTGEVVWEWHLWDHLVQDHDSTKANFGDVAAHPELVDINFAESLDAAPAPAGPGPAGPRPSQGGRPAQGPGEGRGQEGRGREAQDDRLCRLAHAAVAAHQPGLDPRQFGRLQPRARPDRDQRARIQRDLDHRPQHHHGRGRRPHGRALGQGRRPALSLGKPARLPRRHQGRPDALRPAQRPVDPRGLPGEGHLLVFNNGGHRPDGSYSSVDELVLAGRRPGTVHPSSRARPSGPRSPSGATRRRRSPTSTPSSSRAPTGSPTATR